MNNKRRDELGKASSHIDAALDIVESVLFDEKYAFKGIPQNLQDSTRGEAIQEAIDNLIDAKGYIKEAKRSIDMAAK